MVIIKTRHCIYMKTINILLLFSLISSCSYRNESDNKNDEKSNGAVGKAPLNKTDTVQILYHGDCSYSLTQPKDWVAFSEPDQDGKPTKVLVMYRPDVNIKNIGQVFIYSNVIFKDDFPDKTLEGFLKGEKKSAIARGEIVIDETSIYNNENKKANVVNYLLKEQSQYFTVAYFEECNYIILITLSSTAFVDFKNNYHYFKEICASYKYLGIKVIDKSK